MKPELFRRPVRAPLAALATLIMVTCAFAQQTEQLTPYETEPALAQNVTQLAPVTVNATRSNLLGMAQSSSQGQALAAQLKTRPLLRPGEVLELVPGLIATQHSGDGKANQYFLRGFNLDHGTDFATYVDGVPVNLPTHAHGQGYTDLNFLIPELIKNVNYQKGPYSTQEGDFSSAGSARIGLHTKLDSPLAILEHGSHRFGRLLAATSVGLNQSRHLIVAAELQRADGVWENPQNLLKHNAILKLTKSDGQDQWSLTAIAYRARWTATDQIPLRAVEQNLVSRFGTLDPTTEGLSSRFSLSANGSVVNQFGKVTVNAYAIRSSLDLFSNFTYFSQGCEVGRIDQTLLDQCYSSLAPRDQFEQVDRRLVMGADVQLMRSHSLFGQDNQAMIGLQLRQDHSWRSKSRL
jgi:TonB-dependent Receptor Plug Domain